MINNLLLLSGNPIPFASAALNIHQPTIKQIGMIGQPMLYTGLQILQFNKKTLTTQDKSELEKHSNFEIIMSIIKDSTPEGISHSIGVQFVLALLFPDHTIDFGDKEIILEKDQEKHIINDDNLEEFQSILLEMFGGESSQSKQEFNPKDQLARRIAEKIKKGRQKVNAQKNRKDNNSLNSSSVFGRYVSILSVGQSKDMNALFNYTVPQLLDEFQRFNLKQAHDLYIQQKMAGAKDVKEVQNWTKNLYQKKTQSDLDIVK